MAYPTSTLTYGNGITNRVPNLGHPETVTVASGVATITSSFVKIVGEGGIGNDDTITTITVPGAVAGDVITLIHEGGDTITVDDANVDLGGATRAFTDGGHLRLRYDGTSWVELSYLDDADNA